jgi:hypothetical protein
MKVGVDLETSEVYIAISSGGVTTSSSMNPKSARVLAAQLVASADVLDTATENGELDEPDPIS